MPENDIDTLTNSSYEPLLDDDEPMLDLSAYEIAEPEMPLSALGSAILDHGGDVGGVSFTSAEGKEVVLLWLENDDIVTLDGRLVMHSPGGINAGEVREAYEALMG